MTYTFTPFGQITGGGGGGPVTAADITDGTTVGRQVLTAANAAAAQTAIGGTTVGKSILVAADAAAVRTAAGATTIGADLFTAASATAARTTLGGTAVGQNVFAAADMAAARTAIGAGTSNLAIGTSSTTAKAGDYTPTKSTVGLSNVDNTTDLNKPISTATQTALDSKATIASVALKADDTAVVHDTGNETIAGVKTFSSSPIVPDASFTIAATNGLQTALDAKVSASLEIASADIIDETDVTTGLISGRRMQVAVDAFTGGVETIFWNSGTSSWPDARDSADKWIFDSKGYPAATPPVGHSVHDEWWKDPA